MTLLVGRHPDTPDGGLVLGLRLARALGEPLVVCTVVDPGTSWADDADPDLGPDAAEVAVTTTHVADRSIPGGLTRAARAHAATMIVLGDGPQRPGTVGARLARSADVPVAVAGPSTASGPIDRVTCGYDGSPGSETALAGALALAVHAGVPLRVASFAARRPPAIPPEVGLDAEAQVVEGWREQILARQRASLGRLRVEGSPDEADAVITGAATIAAAAVSVADAVADIDWTDGDLFVVGATRGGAAARVLLGDRATEVLAAVPVPLVVVPETPTL